MVAGMAGYFLYRKRKGLDPRSSLRVARPERPVRFWRSPTAPRWCPIFGTDVSTDAMTRAAALVGPDAEVEALYVLKVPRGLPGRGRAWRPRRSGPERARGGAAAGARRGLKVRVKLIRTRNPGAAIVEEAEERHSDLIYISTDHAPRGERLVGPITEYVLGHRPCRVVVDRSPLAEAPEAH